MNKRVVVAMSGGVDSSVTAAILLRQGYDVVGVTMRLWSDDSPASALAGGCCVLGADDARAVCATLGIRHYVLNFAQEFEEEVVEYFCRDYERGRTPNPCLACNDRLKFNTLLERTAQMGADYLATGHYARIRGGSEGWELLRGVDPEKDQSYALFTVGQAELSRLLFPLGGYRKPEVRDLARELGLPVAEKKDSYEICFVPNDDYRSFLAGRVRQEPGEIRDTTGRVLGTHDGLGGYTVGQRRGLGVALGERRYVVGLDRSANVVTIGGEHELLSSGLRAQDLRWVSGEAPAGEAAVEAQVRYRAPAVPAVVRVEDDWASVRFRERQRAITPGQAVVFYERDRVLGGGIIAEALA
jgi:tRNA-specific 2-thiouridylase